MKLRVLKRILLILIGFLCGWAGNDYHLRSQAEMVKPTFDRLEAAAPINTLAELQAACDREGEWPYEPKIKCKVMDIPVEFRDQKRNFQRIEIWWVDEDNVVRHRTGVRLDKNRSPHLEDYPYY